MRAEHVGEEVLLHRIVEMVEEARGRASPSERLAERAAGLFIPAVLVLAAGAGLYWLLAAGPAQAGFAALAVVVVACPCAMGIATPLATALAVGRAAREGVVVRGGDVMERIGTLDVLFLDKTGTVTTGRPALVAVEALDPAVSEDEVLGLAGGAGVRQRPPAGGGRRRGGAGARARGRRRARRAGDRRPRRARDGDPRRAGARGAGRQRGALRRLSPAAPGGCRGHRRGGRRGTAGREDACCCWTSRARTQREAVAALQEAGVRVVLLSGDRAEAARSVAEAVGIAAVEAPRTPAEKVELVRRAAAEGLVTGMVGDGINDAPALGAAEVGIALGAGTDLARQAGNVVLLSDRLAQVPWLIALEPAHAPHHQAEPGLGVRLQCRGARGGGSRPAPSAAGGRGHGGVERDGAGQLAAAAEIGGGASHRCALGIGCADRIMHVGS